MHITYYNPCLLSFTFYLASNTSYTLPFIFFPFFIFCSSIYYRWLVTKGYKISPDGINRFIYRLYWTLSTFPLFLINFLELRILTPQPVSLILPSGLICSAFHPTLKIFSFPFDVDWEWVPLQLQMIFSVQ